LLRERVRVLSQSVERIFATRGRQAYFDITGYTEQTLMEMEEARAQGGFLPRDREDLADMLETHSFLLEGAKEALAMGDIKEVEYVAQHLIQEKSLPLVEGSPEFRLLCRELLKMGVLVQTIEMARLGGNYDNRYDRRYSLRPPVQPAIDQGKPESLSKLIKRIRRETAGGVRWIPKTAPRQAIYTSSENRGDRDVRTLATGLSLVSGNPSKLPQHEQEPTARQESPSYFAMKVETLSETFREQAHHPRRALIEWAVGSQVETNYRRGLTIARKAAKESEEREAYSSEEIGRLLASPLYGDTPRARASYQKHPEHYWIPLIGLFSGMRLNEICQLHVEDIEGSWGEVTNAEGTRKLKNLASEGSYLFTLS
jgi:integrase